VTLTPIAAGGSLTIYQTPAAENNWTLILEFNDDNAAGAAMYVGEVTVSTAVNVPNVVSVTQAAAVAAITNAGLVPGSVALHWSSTVAPGEVLSETPAAGTIAASGAPVTLVLSSGAAPIVAVPNVVGATPTAAVAAITDAGLVAGSGTGGTCVGVLGETPAAGTSVASGTTVNLFAICPGNIFFATVPNVVGDTYAAAVTALNNGGFGGGTTTYIVDTSVPAQIVVATNPGAGYQIVSPPESLSVSIVVSLGSAGITTTTSLLANPPSVPTAGGSVTLTATVSSSNVPSGTPSPTGTVTFTDQYGLLYGTPLCSAALTSELAACSANISSPDTVMAQYSGDPNYLASAGSVTVTVSGQPFVGGWSGNIASTCGFYSGPIGVQIFASVDANQLGLTDSHGDTYGLTISSANPNVATSTLNGGITYTISGNSMTVSEPAACQTGTLTRQ
jgi:beta-lactam-binding protein with PASTA domain